MHVDTYVKAKTIIELGMAKIDVASNNFIYFTVKSYDVLYDQERNRWCCTCEFMSAWVGESGRICHHVRAAQLLIL